jgi:hypothetical protein
MDVLYYRVLKIKVTTITTTITIILTVTTITTTTTTTTITTIMTLTPHNTTKRNPRRNAVDGLKRKTKTIHEIRMMMIKDLRRKKSRRSDQRRKEKLLLYLLMQISLLGYEHRVVILMDC